MKCKKRKSVEVVERVVEVVERVVEVVERVAEVVPGLQLAVDVRHIKMKRKNLNLPIAKAKLIKPH
jgi:hypothetical protein